ncbi:MAG TPA: FAD-dependent monooxygenase [Candidatus Binatia bacterium]|nr:FAD-dependent monooxygenase [Candidatus Binatia bacterium]
MLTETDVLIVGAGPVGLTLAIDLGWRGVKCMVVERNDAPLQIPKLERCNARTMEIFRRLGASEQIRAAGFPRELPMDVFVATSLADPPILRLPYPSVAEMQADIAAHNDGTRPLEPYQLISQYTLEPVLCSVARGYPNVELRFSEELLDFTQDADSVVARVRAQSGEYAVTARYLVGCDGGTSVIRKQLGIRLEGKGGIREMRRSLFRCNDLFERIKVGKGRHYHIADAAHTTIVVQDDTKRFTMSSILTKDDDVVSQFRRAVRIDDLDIELLWTGTWTQHLLCADRYRAGRAFIAGDAAHLVIPTGGLGMNTGVGDATDLAWKLAGTLAGWGGPTLLDSYEIERRQIGLRNVRASGNAAGGRVAWRSAYKPDVREDTPEGAATRAQIARLADSEQRKTNEILGIEMGYRYVASPIVEAEDGEGPDPDNATYVPTTWPGARLPHVWVNGKTAMADLIGKGYTLLRLRRADTSALERAFAKIGAPLTLLDVDSAQARAVYERTLLLIRPDLHVTWRGDTLPGDCDKLATLATGQSTRARLVER